MKNEDLPFALTMAFILHLVVIAIYDLTKDLQPDNIAQPRIIKIKLGSSNTEETYAVERPNKKAEIQIAKKDNDIAIIKEEKIIITKPTPKPSQEKKSKPKGSEYGNSNDDDAVLNPSYLDLLQITVQERSSIPYKAIQEEQSGKAILRLSFNRLGIVTKYRLLKSTGFQILDNEALRVAESLTRKPFPPVPTSFDPGQKKLTYDFPISFDHD